MPADNIGLKRLLYLNNHSQIYADNFIKTTKYSMLNFLPLSVLNQYRKLANCYFLLVTLISLIPGISPWAPISQIVPTVFVLFVAVVREGIEDYMRYKQDVITNSQVVERVVTEGEKREVAARGIKVGDVIRIKEGQEVPADLILVQSSDAGLPEKAGDDQP
jgi:magnesium-transporting ATPase (P-type)